MSIQYKTMAMRLAPIDSENNIAYDDASFENRQDYHQRFARQD